MKNSTEKLYCAVLAAVLTSFFLTLLFLTGCGWQASKESKKKLVEIFNELITWLPMFTLCVYSSKIDFRPGKKDFKDILIETDLTLYKNSDNKETGSAKRKSIYRWNGKRYVGKFNVPDCGRND